jgi:hypothetical protein
MQEGIYGKCFKYVKLETTIEKYNAQTRLLTTLGLAQFFGGAYVKVGLGAGSVESTLNKNINIFQDNPSA